MPRVELGMHDPSLHELRFASSRELGDLRVAAAAALRNHGRSERHIAAVQLVLSELATNALMHADPPFCVAIDIAAHETLVMVRDGGSGDATARRPAFLDGGYGLNLINVLASNWGASPNPSQSGKNVWAAIDRDAEL